MGKVLIGLGWMEGGGAGLPGVCQHRVECNHEGEINHCCIPPPNTNIPHSGRAKSKCQARHRSSAICVNIERLLSLDTAPIPTSVINEPAAASSNAGCFTQNGHSSNLPENCNYQLWTQCQWRDISWSGVNMTTLSRWRDTPSPPSVPSSRPHSPPPAGVSIYTISTIHQFCIYSLQGEPKKRAFSKHNRFSWITQPRMHQF